MLRAVHTEKYYGVFEGKRANPVAANQDRLKSGAKDLPIQRRGEITDSLLRVQLVERLLSIVSISLLSGNTARDFWRRACGTIGT
jgi:hypothetical protein